LEQHSQKAARIVLEDIKKHVKMASVPRVRDFLDLKGYPLISAQANTIKSMVGRIFSDERVETRRDALHQLVRERLPTDEEDDVVYNLFGIIVNSSANWSRG